MFSLTSNYIYMYSLPLTGSLCVLGRLLHVTQNIFARLYAILLKKILAILHFYFACTHRPNIRGFSKFICGYTN